MLSSHWSFSFGAGHPSDDVTGSEDLPADQQQDDVGGGGGADEGRDSCRPDSEAAATAADSDSGNFGGPESASRQTSG